MINYNEEFINISSEEERNVWTMKLKLPGEVSVDGENCRPEATRSELRGLFNQTPGLEKLIYILLVSQGNTRVHTSARDPVRMQQTRTNNY